MADYLKRFELLKQEIENRPYLEVVEFKINPPASGEVLKKVEDLLGTPLDKSLMQFYQEANGLKLYWRIKSKLPEAEAEKLNEEFDDFTFELPDDKDEPFACINLLPLEDSLLKKTWKEVEIETDKKEFEFGKQTLNRLEFAKRLKPFDLFSMSASMAFLIEQKKGNPRILQLSDYFVTWNNSRITDFATYLEILFVTRGIVEARDAIFSEYRGDRKRALRINSKSWVTRHTPKMFRS